MSTLQITSRAEVDGKWRVFQSNLPVLQQVYCFYAQNITTGNGDASATGRTNAKGWSVMAIITSPLSVTRETQIEVGKFYVIHGTIFNPDWRRKGLDKITPIPPQLIFVTGKVWYDSIVGDGFIPCKLWIDLGEWGMHHFPEHELSLRAVNIPEHGFHDRHLKRVPENVVQAMSVMKEINRRQDYGEIVGYRKGERGF